VVEELLAPPVPAAVVEELLAPPVPAAVVEELPLAPPVPAAAVVEELPLAPPVPSAPPMTSAEQPARSASNTPATASPAVGRAVFSMRFRCGGGTPHSTAAGEDDLRPQPSIPSRARMAFTRSW
jgi:hypothetical protein